MSWTRVLESCPRCKKKGCSAVHDTVVLVNPPSAVLRCLDCKKIFLVRI